MSGTEHEPTATAGADRDVLECHGFTTDAPTTDGFRDPGHRFVVTVTEAEPAWVNIAARTNDERSRRYRWEIDLDGVPATVLDATLHAATR